jgi:Carbon starvation protein CstA
MEKGPLTASRRTHRSHRYTASTPALPHSPPACFSGEVLKLDALPPALLVLGIFVAAYRYYGAFLAARVFVLDDRNITPAQRFNDGCNYVPSPRRVVFGHHFAAFANAGPLVGPPPAAQFGYALGLLWLVAGAVLAGTVPLLLTSAGCAATFSFRASSQSACRVYLASMPALLQPAWQP